MKLHKEHQAWIEQYAKSQNITTEQAVNKLIGEVRDTREAEQARLQQEIIERLPNLTYEQIREIRQFVENAYPTFFHVLSKAMEKETP